VKSGADELIAALDLFLDGRAGVTETSREVARYYVSHVKEQFELFKPFLAASSETDAFPIGPPRQFWSATALKREDEKRAVIELRHFHKLQAAVAPLRQYALQHGKRIR
jgi:hypothetical protein